MPMYVTPEVDSSKLPVAPENAPPKKSPVCVFPWNGIFFIESTDKLFLIVGWQTTHFYYHRRRIVFSVLEHLGGRWKTIQSSRAY